MEQNMEQAQATPVKTAVNPNKAQPIEAGSKWYKKWWILAIVVIIILGIAGYFIFM